MKLLFLLLVLAVVFGIPTLCQRWIPGFWTATLVASVASSLVLGLLFAIVGTVGMRAFLGVVLCASIVLLVTAGLGAALHTRRRAKAP